MKRPTLGLLLIAALLSQGCMCLLVCPETYDDMRLRADALDLPEDFVLVSEDLSGMRSRFMAASPPEVQRGYAAPWDDGKLCDRIRSLTESLSAGPSSRPEYAPCGFDTQIGAGWRAWRVNVWSYKMFVRLMPPDSPRPSKEKCIEVRQRHEQQVQSGAGLYQ